MDQQQSFRWNGRATFGVLVLLFGAMLLLNNVDIIDVGPLWRLWPLILVVIGVNTLLNSHYGQDSGVGVWRRRDRRPHAGGGVWLIFLGLWFLLSLNHPWGLHFKDTWPILIIGWGASLLWRSAANPHQTRIAEENHGT